MSDVKCTLCGNDQCEKIDTSIRNDINQEYTMYECKGCGTHFLYPLPKPELLELYYDGTFRKEVHTAAYYNEEKLTAVFNSFSNEAGNRVNRVTSELKPTDDVLEIGCSVGYFLVAIADKVNNVYGTEWDGSARSYIDNVIHHPRIHVAKNPEDFNRKFDKIFMFHVLEHIESPIKFLQALKPLLKENGKIYIEVPNVDDILVKTFHSSEFKNHYYKKAHLYNFNEKGLSYIFEQSKFNHKISFIQRYDISNHFFWLANKKPGGKGVYKNILSDDLNSEYVKCLQKAKQTDTLFATIWTSLSPEV